MKGIIKMSETTCSKCNKEFIPTRCGTGYGVDKDNNRVCYSCCAISDKEQMRTSDKIVLYLTKKVINEKRGEYQYHVTNWPGTLDFPVYYSRNGCHNIAGTREDVWFVFEGKTWHGIQYGNFSEICHCKVTKN